jgi:AcrR family transcriptional regulator
MSPARPKDRPNQILAAARAAILQHGVADVRVADIAREAKVSTAAVHYHFDAKQDVIVAAFRWSSERLFEEIEARLAACTTVAQRLACLLEISVPQSGLLRDEYVIWIQFWARVLSDPGLLPECEAVSARWRGYFETAVADGCASGELSPVAPAQEVADRLLALIDGMGFETVIGYRWATVQRMRERLWRFASEQLGTALPRWAA